ncbi:uncharacterized protein LOC100893510 [Strongylocentrotus purpuratus]|uniref:Death domain-containing protein n=1 Tax=Strongylocentrotus purpuratus TaxID=7668 RepID=A0A7M7NQD5_STRPU|nr:uncharacterized protein LOC100893510 [Strongylocentrotus purpuratus]
MQGLKALHAVAAEDLQIYKAKNSRKPALDLRGLCLTQIPDSICCGILTKCLTSLDVSHNQLTCLPSCISRLSSLRDLRASRNLLNQLPEDFGCLRELALIDLSHNHLTHIPLCLDNLECMQHVNLSGNRIGELRASTFHLPRLRTFHVTRNPVANVPQDVYLDGLPAIRRFFDVSISVPQQVCWSREDPHSSLCEEIAHLQLKHVNTRHKSVDVRACASKPTYLEDSHNERTSAFRIVRNGAAAPHKQLQRLESDGHVSTSDYGSCTGSMGGSAFQGKQDDDANSCCGDQGSDAGDVPHEKYEEIETCDTCHKPLTPEVDFEDDEAVDFILPNRSRFLKTGHAAVLIPEHNKSNILRMDFFLELLGDLKFVPEFGENMIHASSVAFLGPHGALFYEDCPAIIRLPLFVDVGVSKVRCFTSNTDDMEMPFWMEIPACDFRVYCGYVLLRTTHFSLFAAMLDKVTPTVTKVINKDEGGKLVVDQVPGVKVDFPEGSLLEDVEASVKVYCSELPAHLRTNLPMGDAFASPTVVLQPHGYFFKVQRDCNVTVELPIPNYNQIVQQFGGEAQLSVWHSPTSEEEPVSWEPLNVVYHIREDANANRFMVIPVEHFSWLTAIWDGIRSKLNNTGMSLGFYSGGAVSMKCQAWMLESSDTEKFGLVVICHRSDDSAMQDVGNYANNVGGSLKPVAIAPGGDIVVKLGRSDYFEADTRASEDPSLEKVEANYKGGEFEMQFACRFKGSNKPKEKEIFGKVFVRRRKEDGSEERLFEFNLIKKSDEPDDAPEDPWTTASLKDLADMHNITVEDNWKQFARALGFSFQDIRTKLGRAADPFSEIVSMYRRKGGEYNEFMVTLSQVGRKLRLNDTSSEESAAPNTGGAQNWKQMLSLRGWFGGGGGNVSPSQSGSHSSSPPSVHEDDENQPGPSGLQQNMRRKRQCPTCEAEPIIPSTPHRYAKRLRLSPTTSESSGGSDDPMHTLRFNPDQSPPRTPGEAGTFCSLPTTSRYSPPHISLTHNPSGVNLVSSHNNNPVLTPGVGMSGMSSIYGPSTSQLTSGNPHMYNNTPYTAVHYGSIPNTAQQAMPNSLSDQENLLRANPQEISQNNLYHIASTIQNNWVKVARFIRDDETLETDIKSIKENHSSPEEQATQMLLQWREKCPDRCSRGILYGALCDLNLKSVAKKCELIYKKSR